MSEYCTKYAIDVSRSLTSLARKGQNPLQSIE